MRDRRRGRPRPPSPSRRVTLGARIIAVCDAFDAIISTRPYTAARTVEQATSELRRCAGTQFDARVIDAFLTVLTARARQPDAAAASPAGLSATTT
jgi:HD-GYP domain-containing protein (c-di-GMP phosphodiesterase class II)